MPYNIMRRLSLRNYKHQNCRLCSVTQHTVRSIAVRFNAGVRHRGWEKSPAETIPIVQKVTTAVAPMAYNSVLNAIAVKKNILFLSTI